MQSHVHVCVYAVAFCAIVPFFLLSSALLHAGIETLGGKYELHDLVQLDANTAGVIIGIEKDYARVLTNQSTIIKPDVRMCKVRCSGAGMFWLKDTSTWEQHLNTAHCQQCYALEGVPCCVRCRISVVSRHLETSCALALDYFGAVQRLGAATGLC